MACTRSEHFKLKKEDGGTFSGWVDIPAGKHQFKFITDGSWITSEEFDRELDGAGNTNNVLEVRLPEVPDTPQGDAASAQLGRDCQLPGLAHAALSPFRFGLEVLFAPIRFLIRWLGVSF